MHYELCMNCGENEEDDIIFSCSECGNMICEVCAKICKECGEPFCEACLHEHESWCKNQ